MAIQYKPQANKQIHLIGSSSKIAREVYNQLLEDYEEENIKWVLGAKWHGPIEVPLSAIDFSNQKKWKANKDKEHVQDFVEEIENEGYVKPIIVVNEPTDDKIFVVDGHHRLLAYKQLKRNPIAYVAYVDSVGGPWDHLHQKQKDGNYVSSQQKK
jgi:disulfide oxidoreductase YuzD